MRDDLASDGPNGPEPLVDPGRVGLRERLLGRAQELSRRIQDRVRAATRDTQTDDDGTKENPPVA